MDAATKPATPLPWSTGPAIADCFPLHGRIDAVGSVARGRDAAYIVHACNAYPELVAALQQVAGRPRAEDDGEVTADEINELIALARALLAKLGEGE